MNELITAAPFIRLQSGKIFVVKVGGSCLQRKQDLESFAAQLAAVHAFGALPVVVHGGGPQADLLQRALGEEVRKVDGRRVTTPLAMRAVRMSMAGEINGEVAAALTAAGAPAVGVCAASAGIALARKRAPMQTTEGLVDFGEVGDILSLDVKSLRALLAAGAVPVVCPPAGDGKGGFLNVNADLLAAELAVALGAAKLVLVTGVAGVLKDPANPRSLLSLLNLDQLRELRKSGSLKDGMLVKATAIERALAGGVERVHVIGGADPQALLVELYTNHGAGTMIAREPLLTAPTLAAAGSAPAAAAAIL
jgi:acetylglutamate kinase